MISITPSRGEGQRSRIMETSSRGGVFQFPSPNTSSRGGIQRSPNAGFTLIELLVVIAIVGLLASVVLASLNTARAKSRDAKRFSEMKELVKALQLYYYDNSAQYPANPATASGACGIAATCVGDIAGLAPTYIGSLPADPKYSNTTNNYRYATNSARDCYVLLTLPEVDIPPIPATGSKWCYVSATPTSAAGTACNSWTTTYAACGSY